MNTATMLARAKVNLFLAVEGARDDGFHELTSVFHALDLADTVRVRPGSGVRMQMEVPGEVTEAGNLAARALDVLGLSDELAVEISKRIPVAAGMGGGSADAAAAFLAARAVAQRWSDDHENHEHDMDVGASLGSDVPFFMSRAGTAIVRGRGEHVTPLAVTFRGWFVIGLTFRPLSTSDVYARWDELGEQTGSGDLDGLLDALASEDPIAVGALLRNDLEAATFDLMPDLAAKKEAMLEAGALGAQIAGSGPTLFALTAGPEQAQTLAEEVAHLFDRVHVCSSSAQSIERVR